MNPRRPSGHPFFVRRNRPGRLRLEFRDPPGGSREPLLLELRGHATPAGLIGSAVRPRAVTGRLVDRGVWKPEGDLRTDFRRGRLAVTLSSQGWNGRFTLLRFSTAPGKDYWHLRKLDASDPETTLPGAVQGPLPSQVGLQLATPVRQAPSGPGWIHEVRRDGLRLLATVDRGRVRLFAPRRPGWRSRLRLLARELSALPARSAILDGDVVAFTPRGTSSRSLLREAAAGDLFYYAFDLLYLDGTDLRGVALVDRKRALARLLAAADRTPHLRFSDHLRGDGDLVARHARELSMEGVVSRRAASPYRAGRGSDWVRLSCRPRRTSAERRDLVEYYEQIAPWLLPHLRRRVLSIVGADGVANRARVDDAEELLALARAGDLVEIRPWAAPADDPGHPDRWVLELEPSGGATWRDLVRAARELRALLRGSGLESFLKTSGREGLHLVVPLTDAPDWPALRAFGRRVAAEFAPRAGKVVLTVPSGEPGAATSAPYSVLAGTGALVSVPLSWEELDPAARVRPFTIQTLPARLARLSIDSWAALAGVRQGLPTGL